MSRRVRRLVVVPAAATFSAIGAPLPLFIMGRPSRVLKVVFDAPTVLYRIGLGLTLASGSSL
jgi:hypothetical protein